MKTIGTKNTQAKAYLAILVSAAAAAIIGLWNRALMGAGLSPTGIVTVRNFGSMVLLTAFFAIKDRSVFRVKKEHLKYFFGMGVISVMLFTCCYFTCQKLCSLAVASVLFYTAPSWVVVLSAVLWKEPITKRKLLALLLAMSGCACVCGLFSGGLTVTRTGILLGLCSGFFYALYSIFSRYALAYYSPMTATVWTFLFAGPASLVLLRPAEMKAVFSQPEMWLVAAGMVGISTVLSYVLYMKALVYVEPGKASIIASIEPVIAAAIGILVFGEPLGILTVVGIVLVLTGVTILR